MTGHNALYQTTPRLYCHNAHPGAVTSGVVGCSPSPAGVPQPPNPGVSARPPICHNPQREDAVTTTENTGRQLVHTMYLTALNEARTTPTRRLRRRERALRQLQSPAPAGAVMDLARLAATILVLEERGYRTGPVDATVARARTLVSEINERRDL